MSNHNRKIAKALTPARQLALRTLLSMQARNEKIQAALNITLASAAASTDKKDKALCTQLVYGCVRLKIRLDWILDKYLAKPEALPSPARRVMRMAAYELLYLSHIPQYATISSYVAAIKSGYGQSLAGVANAVLRKVSSGPHDEAWFKSEIPDPIKFLEAWHSQPEWIVDHFMRNYPEADMKKYLEAGTQVPPLGIRANRLSGDFNAVCEELAKHDGLIEKNEEAFAFAPGKNPEEMGALLAEGKISRQSYPAQKIMQAIFSGLKTEISSALKSGPIWDVCAGQGGKTCWMLEHGLPVSLASDTSTLRLEHLHHELARLKLPAPAVITADAALPLPVKEQPGIILIDAPCSGLGTLSRRPDIKLYRKPEELPRLAELQEQILFTQFEALPGGGLLIYLTCTLNPDENQKPIDKLLDRFPSSRLIFTCQSPPGNPAYEFFWAAAVQKQA